MTVAHAVGTGAQRGEHLARHLGGALSAAWLRWCDHMRAIDVDPYEHARHLEELGAWQSAARYTPDLVDELQSLAHSAQVPWRHVAALALLDESWALTGGMACTAVAITRPGVRVAGQNMDLPLWTDTLQSVLSVRDADGLGVVAATYPGSPATCGVNSNGVVVLVNALDLAVDLAGTPVSFVVRGALHCASAREAMEFIRTVPHAVGQTYTVMDAQDLFMVEAAADGVVDVPLHSEVSLHTNHAFTRDHEVSESSRTRYQAIECHRGELVDLASLKAALRDQQSGVCQQRGRFTPDMYSFMGVVGDCLTRRVWVNTAPADGGEFTEVAFPDGP